MTSIAASALAAAELWRTSRRPASRRWTWTRARRPPPSAASAISASTARSPRSLGPHLRLLPRRATGAGSSSTAISPITARACCACSVRGNARGGGRRHQGLEGGRAGGRAHRRPRCARACCACPRSGRRIPTPRRWPCSCRWRSSASATRPPSRCPPGDRPLSGIRAARAHPRDRGPRLRAHARRARRRRDAGHRARTCPASGCSSRTWAAASSPPRSTFAWRPTPSGCARSSARPTSSARAIGRAPSPAHGFSPEDGGAAPPRHRLRHALRLRPRGAVARAPRLRQPGADGDRYRRGRRPGHGRGPGAAVALPGPRPRQRLSRRLRHHGGAGPAREAGRELDGARVAGPDGALDRPARPRGRPRHARPPAGGRRRSHGDDGDAVGPHAGGGARGALSATPGFWTRPSVPLGTHPPEWPARAA